MNEGCVVWSGNGSDYRALLWSRPCVRTPAASGGSGSDPGSRCTALLLSWGLNSRKTQHQLPQFRLLLGRFVEHPKPCCHDFSCYDRREMVNILVISLSWITACGEGGMYYYMYPTPSKKQHSPIDRCVTYGSATSKCFRSRIHLLKSCGSWLITFGGISE